MTDIKKRLARIKAVCAAGRLDTCVVCGRDLFYCPPTPHCIDTCLPTEEQEDRFINAHTAARTELPWAVETIEDLLAGLRDREISTTAMLRACRSVGLGGKWAGPLAHALAKEAVRRKP